MRSEHVYLELAGKSHVIDLAQQDGTDLIKILVAADELGLQKIVEVIKQYLIDNQSELLIRNPIR
ncbi:13286_t:CDS:2, partial [Racocetra fulgida]